MIQKTCAASGQSFTISDEDEAWYKKFGVPLPTLCPLERQRRRLAWRNERTLYKRKCDATGESIVAIYPEEVPFPVYKTPVWWSDHYDPSSFGRDFDFTRPFFEQFGELLQEIPMPARTAIETTTIGSDYCNEVGGLKNCYLCFETGDCENVSYGRGMLESYDVLDGLNSHKCQACYEIVESHNCSFSRYLYDCKTCSECLFCSDCIGCQNCFGCVNLRNKEYYFLNQPLQKEVYEQKVQEMLDQYTYPELLEHFWKHKQAQYHKAVHNLQAEDCVGDYLVNAQNCHHCYSCGEIRDARYCDSLQGWGGIPNHDCMDISHFGGGVQFCYECECVGGFPGTAQNMQFCGKCWPGANLRYCYFGVNDTQDCFGSVGLKKGRHMILNKSYTKEEYEKLNKKIVQHMQETKEWGEFFPVSLSPFAYNETIAQEYFTMSREEALGRGYRWRDQAGTSPLSIRGDKGGIESGGGVTPPRIADVPDSITDQVLYCEASDKPYKIQKSELAFYRKMNLPIPRRHPDMRHEDRMARRNPRALYDRVCEKCQKPIVTSYSPDRPEKVLCEACYLEVVE